MSAPTSVHSGVVTMMTTIANTVDRQGRLYCGHGTLATMTSFSVRWVRHLLKELVGMGLLVRERRGGGRSKWLRFSSYRLAFPGGTPALEQFLAASSPAQLTGRRRRKHTGAGFKRPTTSQQPGDRLQHVGFGSGDPGELARLLRGELTEILGKQSDEWLVQVVSHVLGASKMPVMKPAAYVLKVVASDPVRFKPTPTPPPYVPDDGGPPATPEQIKAIRARYRRGHPGQDQSPP
ncbi:hypothetical protein SAMN06309944_0700 [Micrococcales bacterium KH10]|nr:hypothetical protein SAMN06309944_0700 [Micrococcales bacterium KH10]